MKLFVTRILFVFCVPSIVLIAQSSGSTLITSSGLLPATPGQSTQFRLTPGTLPPIPGQDQVGFWSGYLGLDSGQQASAKTIFTDRQTSTDALRHNLEEAQTALDAAKRANSVDSEIDRLSAEVGVVLGQLIAVDAKAYMKFYSVLSADQKQKFDKLSAPPPGTAGLHLSGREKQ